MAWWRCSRPVRTLVMVLLLWTGVDLTNAGLCALDQEQDAVALQGRIGATVDARTPAPSPVAPGVIHIDDCFCCSHCVELSPLWPGMGPEPVERRPQPLVTLAPRIFGLQQYHPPLA